jgi:hypothetical protein
MLGDDGLIAVLRAAAGQPADAIADRVLTATIGPAPGEPHDDIAILVVQDAR